MADSQQHYSYHQTVSSHHAPSASQVLALATLLPLGATLLILAGITLTGTVIGIAVASPLFVIFSPVLVPAALAIGLAVVGFLTSGAFGVTGLSALVWMANYVRRSRLPEQLQHATDHVAKTIKEAGDVAQGKAQELGLTAQNNAQDEGRTS